MADTLTIFIDGLPFDELQKMEFSREFASQGRLVPGLGYSVNCQTQLFTGKTPDEIGFWCEWTYDPEHSPFRWWGIPLRLMSLFESSYFLKRAMHRVIDKLSPTMSTKNIPLGYLPHFAETGHSVFSPSFDQPSLLDHSGLKKFLHHQFPGSDHQDRDIFEATKAYIENSDSPGHVFLTLVKIDHCSHWEGVGSAPYDEMLAENDRYIRELTESFLSKAPDGRVFVISDHGMSNIEDAVVLDLEGEFGSPSIGRYSYFTEGTILRVWVDDDSLCEKIAEYVGGLGGLDRLSEQERIREGLTRREFGDLIYHTPVGTQIVPSFWGPKPSAGMHGHHRRFAGQHGICLSNRSGDFEGEVSALDFYRSMSSALED
jgi:predicted AlkP superfamily pyrophosphatase or phosphodiesterase